MSIISTCLSIRALYAVGERERAHLVVQLARFSYVCVCVCPSVSPDTVSLLNVSTRFYLGVHAERNIATTVYGSSTWLYHRLQILGPSSTKVDTPPRDTSAASCSVCCTKTGSIQHTSYKPRGLTRLKSSAK